MTPKDTLTQADVRSRSMATEISVPRIKKEKTRENKMEPLQNIKDKDIL